MRNKYKILFAVMILLCSFTLMDKDSYASKITDSDVITNGIFIDEINIGNLTKDEARQAVDSFLEDLRSKEIVLYVDGNKIVKTMGEIDYKFDSNDYIDQAMEIGKFGNLIKRYKEMKDVEDENIVYPLNFTFNEDKLIELIDEEVKQYNIAPINATVNRVNNNFVYTDHKIGRKVLVDETIKLITDVLNDWDRDVITLDVVVVDSMPKFTRDIVEKCNAVLGNFKTQYSSSGEGRSANLSNGAKLINNAVLYPGEIFSAYEYLTPFTVENGYYEAGAYANGKVVDSIGGGACQITTTLYNAALYSELEIVERAAHSMTISYADLSRDAAIAGTYKDLKFKNNTNAPILIEAITIGKEITFIIWGNETREPTRKIEYETVVNTKVDPPKEVVTEDPTKPTTYRVITQSAHIGYTTELYKVVYENGVEVSRTRMNRSTYAATPRYITVGTKVVEEKPKLPIDDEKIIDDKKPAKEEKAPKEEKPAIEEEPITEEMPLEELDNLEVLDYLEDDEG